MLSPIEWDDFAVKKNLQIHQAVVHPGTHGNSKENSELKLKPFNMDALIVAWTKQDKRVKLKMDKNSIGQVIAD